MPDPSLYMDSVEIFAKDAKAAIDEMDRLDEEVRKAKKALEKCLEKKKKLKENADILGESSENSDKDFLAWAKAVGSWGKKTVDCDELRRKLKEAEDDRARNLPELRKDLQYAVDHLNYWFDKYIKAITP